MLESTKEQITQRYDKKLNAALSAEKTNRKDVKERLTESEKEKEKKNQQKNFKPNHGLQDFLIMIMKIQTILQKNIILKDQKHQMETQKYTNKGNIFL